MTQVIITPTESCPNFRRIQDRRKICGICTERQIEKEVKERRRESLTEKKREFDREKDS
jgi:hypothetical protein